MAARFVSLSFLAHDPLLLARFWSAALRWEIAVADDDTVELAPTDDTGFPIRFVRSAVPKLGQNRVHFDLTTTSFDDQRDTVEQLISLGGRHIDIGQGPDDTHVVLADPEGNELCIIEPTNNFLATCPRLGAVNCDGTQALGYFWHHALEWPLVWDRGEETAIRDPSRRGPFFTWSGPPLMPKLTENRMRFEVAPSADGNQSIELDRLLQLGATQLGHGPDGALTLADPDVNAFRLRAEAPPISG